MKKGLLLIVFIALGFITAWYMDAWREPVENIDILIGKDRKYAFREYFTFPPDQVYTINIKRPLTEFHGGVLKDSARLQDSIVRVYTWEYLTDKKTIWVADTDQMKDEILDAIRYSKWVRF